MKLVFWLLAIGSLMFSGAQVASAAQAKTELEGTWIAVSAERDGRADGELNGNRLTLSGNHFVIQRDGRPIYGGTFHIDAHQKPPHITFRHTDGALKGKKWKGIYEVENDMLKIADNAIDTAKPRPTVLEAKPNSGHIKINFRRAKP